jgi:hypothetical protein
VTDRGSPLYPEAPKRHRIHRGLMTERQEHIFNWVAVVVVLLYLTAWVGAVSEIKRVRNTPVPVAGGEHEEPAAPPPTPVQSVAGEFFGPEKPKGPEFLSEAMLEMFNPLRGQSGDLRYVPLLPGSRVVQNAPAAQAMIAGRPGELRAPAKPGVYQFSVANKPVENMSIVTLVPRSAKRAGRIGRYQLGSWPFEGGGRPRTPRYAAPAGFIEVTPQNQNFNVSEHFQLRQFLTKDQFSVWPKYVPLDPLLVDKLELIIQELQSQGVRVEHIHVMSGFRTPRYNAGGGNTAGRANLSRHMYGDAADVYVDNNRDGQPDDITGDGRVTIRDAEKFAAAAERVERKHSSLVGGIGVYVACCGHGPFTHIDVRGFRARWRGSGSG